MSDYPIAGHTYTVRAGDTLSSIAARAYGDPLEWPRIYKANGAIKNPDSIRVGQVLTIPEDPTFEKVKTRAVPTMFKSKPKDMFTLVLDGLEVPVISGRMVRAIDTMGDSWTAEIAWTPGKNKDIDKRVAPYSYSKAQVYLGSTLVCTGRIYGSKSIIRDNGVTKHLEGFSGTADLIDSTMRPPYQYNNVDLKQLAESIIRAIGVGIVFDANPGGPFEKVKATRTDTIGKFFSELAFQRGMLLSNTEYSEALFTRANASQEPVGTIEEGKPGPTNWEAHFDGRKRFHTYVAISQTGGGDVVTSTSIDDAVPTTRELTFQADDSTKGGIKVTADWKRSKQIIDALTIPFPVSGWYAPNGKIWQPNTLVTVIAPSIHVMKGFTFLIRETEHVFENSGNACTLHITPPQALTGEKIIEPWRAA